MYNVRCILGAALGMLACSIVISCDGSSVHAYDLVSVNAKPLPYEVFRSPVIRLDTATGHSVETGDTVSGVITEGVFILQAQRSWCSTDLALRTLVNGAPDPAFPFERSPSLRACNRVGDSVFVFERFSGATSDADRTLVLVDLTGRLNGATFAFRLR